MQSGKIVIQSLSQVFGPNPEVALDLLRQRWSKERVLAKTGAVVGVNNVSFEVQEGEIFVLMGLSGSGKSTLIRLINRLIEPSAGRVFIDGQDVARLPLPQLIALRRRDMSMVFQSFALMPTRTVLDNAAFGLEVAGVPRRERERRASEVLEQVGLTSFARHYPHELSGGMQQRVGLARALAVNPSMIIMDEAFSALDPLKRREMQDILLQLQKEHRRTIVFVSHDIEEAIRIGSRIGIMEGGSLIQVGTPQQIIEHPANDYVRSFFNTIDTSRYLTARQLMADSVPVFVHNGKAPETRMVTRTLQEQDKHYAFVIDENRSFRGSISLERLALLDDDAIPRLESQLLTPLEPVPHDMPLDHLIERMARIDGPIPVVDAHGHYCGAISKGRLLGQLRDARA